MLDRKGKIEDMLERLRRLEATEQQLLSAITEARLAEIEDRDRRYREQAALETAAYTRKCALHSHNHRVLTPR
jgi:hypothetical protein